MGQIDIARIHPIYRKCVELNNDHNWGFSFKVDTGEFETMIQFIENEFNEKLIPSHPPLAKNWDELNPKFCNAPDIMAFNDMIIIEVEEESKAQRGPKIIKKGHWSESKHDEERDLKYKRAGFRVCKIWESEIKNNMVENKLFHFLSDCYCNRIVTFYSGMFLTEKELRKALKERK